MTACISTRLQLLSSGILKGWEIEHFIYFPVFPKKKYLTGRSDHRIEHDLPGTIRKCTSHHHMIITWCCCTDHGRSANLKRCCAASQCCRAHAVCGNIQLIYLVRRIAPVIRNSDKSCIQPDRNNTNDPCLLHTANKAQHRRTDEHGKDHGNGNHQDRSHHFRNSRFVRMIGYISSNQYL